MTVELSTPADMPRGKGNCGIVAVAIFTGSTHQQVWDTIKKQHRKPGNWGGGTRHYERLTALRALNKGRSVAFAIPGKPTLQAWARENCREGVTYMVRTTGHIQCVKRVDGVLWYCDQRGTYKLENCRGKLKRATWACAKLR